MTITSDKRSLTEEDIKLQFITPAIVSKWNPQSQIRMEAFFTDGRVHVRGNHVSRGKRKKADYLLFYKSNIPLAVVEAKENNASLGSGMQQAIAYAEILDVPFAYSSNGDAFLEHDMKAGTEREIPLSDFPTPEELWKRYQGLHDLTPQEAAIVAEPYYYEMGKHSPRYYQMVAINRTIEAIAKGQNRILLVMATGTGKTYTAFQIIHRLWKSGTKKKILYLADRNILIDQTIQQDFSPFEKVMTKITNKKLDSSYEIYLSLYHQLAGDENEEPFREFKKDFFDLIIVDECHRGSARDDSRWRKILDYFEPATKIGMTATPKQDDVVNNLDYFGNPIYTYSLRQGIEDGFLAPFKVIRVGTNVDLEGWRPSIGLTDDDGNDIEDREYNSTDYDRNIELRDRTHKVAQRITKWLKENDRMAKTIVFCVGVNHAEIMRQELVNLNSDMVAVNNKYVMRITGDDAEGKAQLENFIDAYSPWPVIATTSKLLGTGVDCKTTKLIVLDNNINSIVEFKQIIGRGTRLRPNEGKMFFTIMDFRNSTRLFADPQFDGEPISETFDCEVCGQNPCICPCNTCGQSPCVCQPKSPEEYPEGDGDTEPKGTNEKPGEYRTIPVIGRGKVRVDILNERVHYLDSSGKLITESLTDYTRKSILSEYATLEDFLSIWNRDLHKQALIEELREHNILLDELRTQAANQDMDDFDLICHIAYDKKPLTKAERANNVRKRDYLNKYEGLARDVLSSLLDKYASEGISEVQDTRVLELEPFRRIGPSKIVRAFGGRDAYLQAIKALQDEIYALAA